METQPVSYFILGVMTLTDARYFSAMGVDYLHFDLNPASSYAIGEPVYQAIAEWVEGSAIICSFDHLFDEERIRKIVEDTRVAGVMSRHPDMLDYVHRIRPEAKLFQQVEEGEDIDRHLLLTGVIGPEMFIPVRTHFLLCEGPLEAEKAVNNGVSKIAFHPGREDQVGIKDFEAYDRLMYGEF